MSEQFGFGFDAGVGFDFGGQAGFDFSGPPDPHAETRRRQREREAEARKSREREEKAERERKAREDDFNRRRDQYRERHGFSSKSYPDPYEVLGLSASATQKEIRSAWAKLCREHHPDVGGDVNVLKRINAAYERLKVKR